MFLYYIYYYTHYTHTHIYHFLYRNTFTLFTLSPKMKFITKYRAKKVLERKINIHPVFHPVHPNEKKNGIYVSRSIKYYLILL